MGEQCALEDMDLTWQEIFSITELQGLDVHPDAPYDVQNGYQTPMLPISGCSFGSFSRDGIAPTANNTMPICNRSYMDCQAQNAATIAMASGYTPTSYTGMLISSSISQMGAINHYPSKHIPPSAMSAPGDQVIMSEPHLGSVNSLHLPSKNHDDFESDSGLSLNFSDGESIEIENIDSHRLHSEFMEMIPQHAYQNQYPLAPNLTQPVMENMCETYFASRTQELVCSRDQRRAAAMQIPFPTDRIVNLPVENFNDLLSRYTLTESQLALVRDIRRRGKNKVAAQNCRKRKMENIAILEKEIGQLRSEREGLRREREEVESIISELKNSMNVLQQEVYSILKNQGSHHNPEDILLHQTPNSNVSFSLE